MSEDATAGRVHHEHHGHILKIIIDNPAKKNAFSPEMMLQLSDALALLDCEDELWVGVLCANGDNFTAGLIRPGWRAGAASRSSPPFDAEVGDFLRQARDSHQDRVLRAQEADQLAESVAHFLNARSKGQRVMQQLAEVAVGAVDEEDLPRDSERQALWRGSIFR